MNNLLKILSSGLVNEKIEENIKEKLLLKYNENFTIYKIGKRFGTVNNETVTAYCKNKNGIIFTSELHVNKVHFYDDYCLRLLCNELEDEIKKEFKKEKISSYPKITIIGLTVLDKKITIKEFLKKYKGVRFLVKLYFDEKISKKNIKKILSNMETKYKSIDIRGQIIILNKDAYAKYTEIFDGINHSDDYYVDTFDMIDTYRIEKV